MTYYQRGGSKRSQRVKKSKKELWNGPCTLHIAFWNWSIFREFAISSAVLFSSSSTLSNSGARKDWMKCTELRMNEQATHTDNSTELRCASCYTFLHQGWRVGFSLEPDERLHSKHIGLAKETARFGCLCFSKCFLAPRTTPWYIELTFARQKYFRCTILPEPKSILVYLRSIPRPGFPGFFR